MEDQLIQQMGLLLTQVRVARMSLERIEQSTATFGGLALSAAGGADRPAFGAPPLIDGALKVYVINVDDFVAPAGGGVFETLLGGVGRLVGGLVGGVVGGVIGGAVLFPMIGRLADLAESVAGIVDQLLNTMGLSTDEWRRVLLGDPDQAAGIGGAEPQSILDAFLSQVTPDQAIEALRLLTYAADSFVILIPIAAGAAATLMLTVSSLRGEILSWIGFLVRNLLLVRGVAVAILSDIASMLTPIIATVFSSIGSLISTVFTGATLAIVKTVEASFTTARTLATAMTSVINAALRFVTSNAASLLNFIGGTTVVRMLAWFMTALPTMLISLAAAAGNPISRSNQRDLTDLTATGTRLLEEGASTAAPTVTPFTATDVTDAINVTEQNRIVTELEALGSATSMATEDAVNQVRETVLGAIGAVETAVENSSRNLRTTLDTHLSAANQQVTALDALLTRAEQATNREPSEVLQRVADSYSAWLSGGGMNLLLDEMTRHFATSPVGADGETPRVLEGFTGADGRHDVVVQVGEVIIELEQSEAAAAGVTVSSIEPPLDPDERARRAQARGGDPSDLLPVGGAA